MRGEIEAATEGPNNTGIKFQEATPEVAAFFNFTNRLTIQDPRPDPQVMSMSNHEHDLFVVDDR
jgi:hypothetical protein